MGVIMAGGKRPGKVPRSRVILERMKMDDRAWIKYEKLLLQMRGKSIPFAVVKTLNDQAFGMQRGWKREIRRSFTTRNKWTERSIIVVKARPPKGLQGFTGVHSEVGTALDYLRVQEHGETKKATGKHGVAVPMDAARIGGADSRPISRGNYLSRLRLKPRRGKGRKGRNADQIRKAKKNKNIAGIELRKGGFAIFKIRGRGKNKQFTMLWAFTKKTIKVKREPTMERSAKKMAKLGGRFYGLHLQRELKQIALRNQIAYRDI